MHFFVHTLISAILIVVAAIVVPGISILNPVIALEIALIFGGLNRSVKNILDYFEIPDKAFYFALFAILVNGFLVAWTSLIRPGFFVGSIMIAVPFIAVLTATNVALHLKAGNVPVSTPSYIPAKVRQYKAWWIRTQKKFTSAVSVVSPSALIASVKPKDRSLAGNASKTLAVKWTVAAPN